MSNMHFSTSLTKSSWNFYYCSNFSSPTLYKNLQNWRQNTESNIEIVEVPLSITNYLSKECFWSKYKDHNQTCNWQISHSFYFYISCMPHNKIDVLNSQLLSKQVFFFFPLSVKWRKVFPIYHFQCSLFFYGHLIFHLGSFSFSLKNFPLHFLVCRSAGHEFSHLLLV